MTNVLETFVSTDFVPSPRLRRDLLSFSLSLFASCPAILVHPCARCALIIVLLVRNSVAPCYERSTVPLSTVTFMLTVSLLGKGARERGRERERERV